VLSHLNSAYDNSLYPMLLIKLESAYGGLSFTKFKV
jgi:hypothetical protein